MKLKSLFSISALMAIFLSLSPGNSLSAQRYLTERKPDLVLLAVTAKKEGVNQLNVIWSIQNQGDAPAQEVDKLLSFILEGSTKPNKPGENHNWVLKQEHVALNISQPSLKPGEILRGNSLLPYLEQENLVSYRVTINVNDDFYEPKKENNTLVTQLVGK